MGLEKGKLFVITRSYPPSNTGGALMRKVLVDRLNDYFDVVVITCGPLKRKDNLIRIPEILPARLTFILQRLGLVKDYLFLWEKVAYIVIILSRIKPLGIISTSGSEMGTISLGNSLSKHYRIKHIAHLRDPIIYSFVNGLRINNKFHVSREKREKRLFAVPTAILCSSKMNYESLKMKYPEYKSRIYYEYIGFDTRLLPRPNPLNDETIRFVYGGNSGALQNPMGFIGFFENIQGVELHIFGDFTSVSTQAKNIFIHGKLNRLEFIDFLKKRCDVGIVSLTSDYLGACVPAKLFELIGLHIPILGLLPDGDASNIINENGFGYAVDVNSATADMILREFSLDKRAIYYENLKLNSINYSDEKTVNFIREFFE